MNESEFEAQLKADGYTEIETQNLDPRPGKGRHRHLFGVPGTRSLWKLYRHAGSRTGDIWSGASLCRRPRGIARRVYRSRRCPSAGGSQVHKLN